MSFSSHRLFSSPGHLLCKGFGAVLLDIPDAGSPVGIKQKGEYLSDEIGMYLACLYVCFTLGTSGITFVLTASSVFAPTGFLVFVATGA